MKHTLITIIGVLWAWCLVAGDITYLIAIFALIPITPLAIKAFVEAA